MKVRMTSNPHGPYGLGYTHATMVITISYNSEKKSESKKIIVVRIVGCNSPT